MLNTVTKLTKFHDREHPGVGIGPRDRDRSGPGDSRRIKLAIEHEEREVFRVASARECAANAPKGRPSIEVFSPAAFTKLFRKPFSREDLAALLFAVIRSGLRENGVDIEHTDAFIFEFLTQDGRAEEFALAPLLYPGARKAFVIDESSGIETPHDLFKNINFMHALRELRANLRLTALPVGEQAEHIPAFLDDDLFRFVIAEYSTSTRVAALPRCGFPRFDGGDVLGELFNDARAPILLPSSSVGTRIRFARGRHRLRIRRPPQEHRQRPS